MPLTSDLTIPASKFDRANIDQQTLDFNAKLIKIWAEGPRWYEVSLLSYVLRLPLPDSRCVACVSIQDVLLLSESDCKLNMH